MFFMLDYRLLEAFAAIIGEGGFERAGAALGLTQSAVSQRLRQLEELTGTILVIRENPPRTSPAGERLLRHFIQTRELEAAALSEARSRPASGFERLSIAVNADSLSTWFLDATLPFWQRRQVLFDLRVDDQERTLRFLKTGEVSACLSSKVHSVTGCSAVRLGAMEYRLCAAPSYAEKWFPGGFSVASAAAAPVIHYNRDDGLQREALRLCFGDEAPDPPAYYLPSTERIFRVVGEGVGYCMIPLVQAAGALRSGALVELCPAGRVKMDLYWHRWTVAPALLEELSAELIARAAELLER
jgi:LysR family transcriptional regulator (chromosome initiation inhibitor)